MIRRSLIVTPGNVATKLMKAETFSVYILMLDIEDEVPDTAEAKVRAWEFLGAAVSVNRFRARELAIRVNDPRSEWFFDNLSFICGLDIPTAVVPIVEDTEDMVYVERTLDAMCPPERLDFYHPAYIDIADVVFTPSNEELDWADKVLASNQGTNSGEAASSKVDGRVVLPQHGVIARCLRNLADEIVMG